MNDLQQFWFTLIKELFSEKKIKLKSAHILIANYLLTYWWNNQQKPEITIRTNDLLEYTLLNNSNSQIVNIFSEFQQAGFLIMLNEEGQRKRFFYLKLHEEVQVKLNNQLNCDKIHNDENSKVIDKLNFQLISDIQKPHKLIFQLNGPVPNGLTHGFKLIFQPISENEDSNFVKNNALKLKYQLNLEPPDRYFNGKNGKVLNIKGNYTSPRDKVFSPYLFKYINIIDNNIIDMEIKSTLAEFNMYLEIFAAITGKDISPSVEMRATFDKFLMNTKYKLKDFEIALRNFMQHHWYRANQYENLTGYYLFDGPRMEKLRTLHQKLEENKQGNLFDENKNFEDDPISLNPNKIEYGGIAKITE